jgi:hypothetical protein
MLDKILMIRKGDIAGFPMVALLAILLAIILVVSAWIILGEFISMPIEVPLTTP